MNICVYGASSDLINDEYIKSTEELGIKMAKRGHGLVFGGGNAGLMGASARGVYKEKGNIVGVAPSFFDVDGRLFEHCTELIFTDTMRERKQILEEKSDAYIVTPGGIGTLDEFFEMLTLKQLGRHAKAIAVFNILGYYDDMVNMLKKTSQQGFMCDASLNLFKIFEDADRMLDWLEKYKGTAVDIAHMKPISKRPLESL
ncbi:MAG: TIGR00730 family Rossman fold protein [Bacillota bacterium]|nr:TIGR00730 family Rossman fold protein [Bacillota bacterium]